MCLQDADQDVEELDNSNSNNTSITNSNNTTSWPLYCGLLDTQMENLENNSSVYSSPVESICEDTVTMERNQNQFMLRSGEWSDIGNRSDMEDTHICISDLAEEFGNKSHGEEEVVSFYGVFDGHEGNYAANFVRKYLPKVIVEDADFPRELGKVITRSFKKTDDALFKCWTPESALSSGTTALTAMIFRRSLLVANAGDCRAVLSRHGTAVKLSRDHRPSCEKERLRVESLGGSVDVDGYLNGQLGVTRALGDWHLEGMKKNGGRDGPLSAEPELELVTLTKEDEFLIIASDGIWDFFSSQNAVDFSRRRLQEHDDVELCCKEIVEEAKKRGSKDNLTIIMVSFHSEPPPNVVVPKVKVHRSISAEGLQNIRCHLEG